MFQQRFAPPLAMSIAVILAFIFLCGLGSWQVYRLFEKREFIALYEANSTSAPIEWSEFRSGLTMENTTLREFQNVLLQGKFLHDKEMYRTGRSRIGEPGLHVLTPMLLNTGEYILVNRGWIEAEYRDRSLREGGLFNDSVTIEGLFRVARPVSGIRAWVLPENDPIKNTWYTLDLPMMAKFSEQNLSTAYYVMDSREGAPRPYGHQWQLRIHNSHLEYAITWYGLALALLAMYIAFGINRAKEMRSKPE